MLRGIVPRRMASLMKCARVAQSGGAEEIVMADYSIADVKLEPHQVLLRNSFAGVNFVDTYSRSKNEYPYTSGDEGSGSVIGCGGNVSKEEWLGKRVAFFSSVTGAYASFSVANLTDLFPIPEEVSDNQASAAILQGSTAHYLVHDCFPCRKGTTVLVHGAAGGTGLLLSQYAKLKGSTVIGVCGSSKKAELASRLGKCDHVIDYSRCCNWAKAVKKLCPDGVHCVYDGVGKSTFEGSLSVLRRRGSLISFGNASGVVPPVSPLTLNKYGSISMQRPSLKHYSCKEDGEIDGRVRDVFNLVGSGDLKIHVGATLPLSQASEAHDLIESNHHLGKILLNCFEW